jgi:hypothetical protein
MVADGMSPRGTITKNTMIVIGRFTEPKDRFFKTIIIAIG